MQYLDIINKTKSGNFIKGKLGHYKENEVEFGNFGKQLTFVKKIPVKDVLSGRTENLVYEISIKGIKFKIPEHIHKDYLDNGNSVFKFVE